jgi:hypothetical protein
MTLNPIDDFLMRRVSEAEARRPGPRTRPQPAAPVKTGTAQSAR